MGCPEQEQLSIRRHPSNSFRHPSSRLVRSWHSSSGYRVNQDLAAPGTMRPQGAEVSIYRPETGSYAVPARRLPPTGLPRKKGRAPARSATAGSKIPPTTLAITGRTGEIDTALGEKTEAITTIFNSGFVTNEPRAARIVAAGNSAAAVRLAIEPPARRDHQAAIAPMPPRISNHPP